MPAKRCRVVLIEDAPEAVSRFLARDGFDATVVPNLEAAAAALRDAPFDVVVCREAYAPFARAIAGVVPVVACESGAGWRLAEAIGAAIGRVIPPGTTVLCADDAPDNRVLLRKILEISGVTVEVAEGGRDAVSKALASEPDVVLMDIEMPDLRGVDALRELRAKGFVKPVLAFTAHDIEKVRDLLSAGFDGYVAKPVRRNELERTIAAALVKGRAAD